MVIVCLWCSIITISKLSPPMRIASGEWAGNVMERIGDIVSKSAITQVSSAIIGITHLFSKLACGDGVARCAAMHFRQRRIRSHVCDSIAHNQQSSLELLHSCYCCWVTKFVHNPDELSEEATWDSDL